MKSQGLFHLTLPSIVWLLSLRLARVFPLSGTMVPKSAMSVIRSTFTIILSYSIGIHGQNFTMFMMSYSTNFMKKTVFFIKSRVPRPGGLRRPPGGPKRALFGPGGFSREKGGRKTQARLVFFAKGRSTKKAPFSAPRINQALLRARGGGPGAGPGTPPRALLGGLCVPGPQPLFDQNGRKFQRQFSTLLAEFAVYERKSLLACLFSVW